VKELREMSREGIVGGEQHSDPLSSLEAYARYRRALNEAERDMIARARRQGITFAQIGKALGVSRQAVHARLRRMKSGATAVVLFATYEDVLGVATSLLT
jgi:DNA invertase Pin-like site-specific DNA recombinase